MTCTAAALAAFDALPVVAVRQVVDFGVAFDSHVRAFEVASEVMDYHANCRASDESDDFGDQCYYSDRAGENLDRLRELGAAAVAFALDYRLPAPPRAA